MTGFKGQRDCQVLGRSSGSGASESDIVGDANG